MPKKRIFLTALIVGVCFSAQGVWAADAPPMAGDKQFLHQIEKNRNQFQGKMFKENQGKIATTGNFQKQLQEFQKDLNKQQQKSVLNSNSLSNDLNKVRSDFQKKMFMANQKQIMKGTSLQERIAGYQKDINKSTQGSITKDNQAGLSGEMGGFLNSFQANMFKENMKKFQNNMFSGTTPPIDVNTNHPANANTNNK